MQLPIFKKGTILYSVLNGKCPKCHEGNFFKYRFTYKPSKITKLHNNCPNCNLKYMLEPSFYFGAMFVSYAISVALFVSIFIIAKLILNLSILQSFAAIIITSLILVPVNLRVSRILWINMFVSFDAKKTNKKTT